MTLEKEVELLRAENAEYKKSLDMQIHLYKIQYEDLMDCQRSNRIMNKELDRVNEEKLELERRIESLEELNNQLWER
jgi:hypothetical protein